MENGFEFEQAYAEWIGKWKGSQRETGKLRAEYGNLELKRQMLHRIWWPAFGTLHGLHAGLEVTCDVGPLYLELAFRPNSAKIAFELGEGSMSKSRFPMQHVTSVEPMLQEAALAADGWTLLRITPDLVERKPRQMQQLLRRIVDARVRLGACQMRLTPQEKELIRTARGRNGGIAPKEVCYELGTSDSTARRLLKRLMDKGLIQPNPRTKVRIRRYMLTRLGMETPL